MFSGISRRKRPDRSASLELPPSPIARFGEYVLRSETMVRIGLCVLASLAIWVILAGWRPPLGYRTGYVPQRDITARVAFHWFDQLQTDKDREEAKRKVRHSYENDVSRLDELQQSLKNRIVQVVAVESFDNLDEDMWRDFWTPSDEEEDPSLEQLSETYRLFRAALIEEGRIDALEKAIQAALLPIKKNGLLSELEHGIEEGSQTTIEVHLVGNPEASEPVAVEEVQLSPEIRAKLRGDLGREISTQFGSKAMADDQLQMVADRVYGWLSDQLPTTLTRNKEESDKSTLLAQADVPDAMKEYLAGDSIPEAAGGVPLGDDGLELLTLEHEAYLVSIGAWEQVRYAAAIFGMHVALFSLCGFYVYYRRNSPLHELHQLITLLVFVVATVGLTSFTARDQWRAEMIPLLLFGMTLTIAYQREVALLFTAALTLMVTLSLVQEISEFVIIMATCASMTLSLGRIRSRTKLIYVGAIAGAVAFLTTLGVRSLVGQPLDIILLDDATWFAFCALMSGVLLTAILPFIEAFFGVQTEISLLELGDAAHPLLQELVQRAPGTYNHSINVASIGEAAAESIGANGLLVRVGAYFHDIGKMLKPGYFVENQQDGQDFHESLLPAMSTLVIIAHVKDGADLARKHNLPQPIIDFILQHHGTTIVEYFFDRAKGQCKDDPDAADVDENSFRYPGPKPQTREAGVMMLADAVESACRSLVEPGPARIEAIVHEIATKRLLDGQFDECNLTFEDLSTVQSSLVKSLTAVYHGRVKYPDQQTA